LNKSVRWGVCIKKRNKIVGVISLYNLDEKHKFVSNGSIIKPDFQNNGLMTEALNAVSNFAFKKLDINRIEAQTFVDNAKSVKYLTKAGFKLEGRLRQNFMIEKSLRDSYIYSLLKQDFLLF